jgi:amidophosphoribosyltransferase
MDKFREECGIMAVFNHPEAANLTYLGLYAQQHRGQEGAGVVSSNDGPDGPMFHLHRGLGLVADVFGKFDFSSLPGDSALGHVRYSTAGGTRIANVQPFVNEISLGQAAIAHNGNLINADELRADLIKSGAIFSSTSDTEVVLHLLARGKPAQPVIEAVIDAVTTIRGAFSLVLLFADRIIAVRDPHGLRPLALARLGAGYVIASETCAFDLIGAKYARDVEPGEIVEIDKGGALKTYRPWGLTKEAPCIFEYVYFARPDSSVFGRNVYAMRKALGVELGREQAVEADLVTAIPDSGVPAALGYSTQTGIPLELGLIRNHYVGRTFIEPQQSIRDFGVKIKFNATPEILKGKRVVVVDDSLVRGTTSRKLVDMLRQAGAKEVHLRISSPPTTNPCYYGIDTPEREQLIAAQQSVEAIRAFIGSDSLSYLSIEGMYRAIGSEKGSFCDACFSGNYPAGTPADYKPKQRTLFKIV